ncbi:MAG: hypothetical protein LH606_15020 [Cytophagaceae bacterium]|nr:hypothetical protein [Cytophagaceae bacterium]
MTLSACGQSRPDPVLMPNPAATTFTNPLKNSGPDPWVTRRNGFYFYTNTTTRNISLLENTAHESSG